MFPTDISFELKSVIKSKTSKLTTVFDRKHSTFYFKLSGSVLYTVNDKEFLIQENDFIFIPAHSNYKVKSIDDGEYISVHFDSKKMEILPPKLFTSKMFPDVGDIFISLRENWISSDKEKIFLCYSTVYSLLYKISLRNRDYIPSNKYEIIAPSIKYLDDHLFDANLEITSLNTYSNISYAYFERLFKIIFYTSPQKYLTSKRLNYAKNAFESGDFSSVLQVAEDSGYSDPLYFSRIFKKETGLSPSMYIKQFR